MKKIICALLLLFVFAGISFATERVKGHWKDTNHDGVKDTYVNPYERTTPNSTKSDNYDKPGNYNPNKGEITPGNPSRESSQDYYKTKKKDY
jgi:hypothetical protein